MACRALACRARKKLTWISGLPYKEYTALQSWHSNTSKHPNIRIYSIDDKFFLTVFCIFKVIRVSLKIKWQILSIISILQLYWMHKKKHIRKRTRMLVKMLLQKFGKIWKKIIHHLIKKISIFNRGECHRFRYVTEGGGILLTLRTVTRGEGGPSFRQKQRYVTFEHGVIILNSMVWMIPYVACLFTVFEKPVVFVNLSFNI